MQKRVNGIDLVYDMRGEGTPVLFIHGFPLNRRMWKPQVNGLSDIANIIAPDLRGHGESEPSQDEYTMDLFAADLNALLVSLGITEKIVLCGLSMGGYIALSFYRFFQERLAGIVLTATRAAADTAVGKEMRLRAAQRTKTEGVSQVVDGLLPNLLSPSTQENKPQLLSFVRDLMLDISPETMIADLMGMKERQDSTPLLPKIDIPVLILHGADDRLIPVDEAETMQAQIPGAELKVIPQAGHLPNLEQPVLFNHSLHKFILDECRK